MLRWIFALVAAFLALTTQAQTGLTNFDKRTAAAPSLQSVEQEHAVAVSALKALVPGAKVDFDEVLGTPKWVTASRGFLTGTNGTGIGVRPGTLAEVAADDPHRATRGFLLEHRALFGFGPEALDSARVQRDYITGHNGLHTVVWQQQVDGIDVLDAVLISHTTKQGELVNLSSLLVPAPARAADAGTPNRAALAAGPGVTARQAVVLAASNINEQVDLSAVSVRSVAPGTEQRQQLAAPALKGEVEARLVWLPMTRHSLRLAWEVILMSRAQDEMFRVVVDASTGEALVRQSLTEHISNASYRVFTTPSPAPFTLGFPSNLTGAVTVSGFSSPLTNQPTNVARVLVVTSALDTNASPAGWLPDGTNVTTTGNNVLAYLDAYADDTADVPPPQGTTNRVFDFPLDLTQDPLTYSNTSVVNLFYWNNWMHDKLYELGFTEAAGNFQTTNFGRGGLGNDPVRAEAQDGYYLNDSHYLDNASFSTPPDGSPPRMEMYVFSGPTPPRDSTFDTEVILHEYTHGLSNRRVGGGVGISAPQSRGLGEGWSDFYSLALLTQPGDDVNGCYPEGPYVSYLLFGAGYNFTQNYYYGIRRYPYCTDTNKDPGTFKDIDPNLADPHNGVPINPLITNTVAASEIHNQGEIWCAALWDARANLINRYGFATGNQLMLQLVTDGMGLTPPNPTFVQARDAVLQADTVDNNALNHQPLWQAFAKRGLGVNAVAPPSSTTTGVTEDYTAPDGLLVTPAQAFNAGGPIGGPFMPSGETISLYDTTTTNLTWGAGANVNWVTLSGTGGTLGSNGGFTNILVSFNAATSNLAVGQYSGALVLTNVSDGVTQTNVLTLSVTEPVVYSFPLNTDPGWSQQGQWAFGVPQGSGGVSNGYPDPASGYSGSNVFGVNLAGDYSTSVGGPYYLTTGPLNFSTSSGVMLQFERWLNSDVQPYVYQTVDVSSDSNTWYNIFANDYGEITDDAWTNCQYDISQYADHQPAVYVRWGYQIMYSSAFAYSGWNIDDIQFLSSSQLLLTTPVSTTKGAGVLTNLGVVSLAHAPVSDLTIQLASSDTTLVTVPASVTLPAGQTNVTFNLDILDNHLLEGTYVVSVNASALGYASATNALPVNDNLTAVLTLNLPASATEGDGTIPASVSMNATAGRNVTVNLISSAPGSLQLPATVLISAGQSSVMFPATVPASSLIDSIQVTGTAHVPNWTDGVDSMTIHGSGSNILSLQLPTQVRENNGTITNAGLVQLPGTLTTNLVVSLFSSNTSKLTVPASATILAGQSSAVFNLTTVSGNLPHNPVAVTVTASSSGFTSASSNLTVIDNQTPPAPWNPHPVNYSTTNPVILSLSWSAGLGEGVELTANGGFESGTFAGWVTPAATNGGFLINNGTILPPSGDGATAPYAGNFSALADASYPSNSTLSQDIPLATNAGTVTLSWVDRVRNFAAGYASNQQFRVEIRNTNNAVLSVVFVTQPGDTNLAGWVQRSVDLTAYAGQTVRVAFVVTNQQDYLDVHLDNVSVRSSTLPPVTNDVYFGTNPTPGPSQLIGNTTNTKWALPQLAPYTTYYWQIAAERQNETPGAVWQFSTLPTLFVNNQVALVPNDGTSTNMDFTVTLSDTNNQTIFVDFSTQDGTAVAAADYLATNGTLTFNPGDSNQIITVVIPGTNLPAVAKVFYLSFSNVQFAALETSQVSGTLLNQHHPPSILPVFIMGGQVSITWTSTPGVTYRVQYASDPSGMWTSIPGDVTATGTTASKLDTSGLTTRRYYRVLMFL